MIRSSSIRPLFALSATLMACAAWGQGMAHPEGSYIGLSLGQSRARLDAAALASRQIAGLQPLPTLGSLGSDDHDRAYRLFLGYQFNRQLGVEVGAFDLGRFSYQGSLNPPGQVDGRLKVQGGSLDLVGSLPLGDRIDLLLRGGAQYARTRSSWGGSGSGAGTAGLGSERKLGYKLGAGLQMAVTPNFLMRVEAEQYRVPSPLDSQMRVRVYSVSAVFPFGRAVSSSRAAAPAPQPYQAMAPAPLPAPPPVLVAVAPPPPPVVAAPPPLRRVSFSAESLFAFDRWMLQPEGRQALDGLARELNGTQFDTMAVEGHADRLGSAAYNQTLSMQRAEAVKAYLVSSGGFAAARIQASGHGEDKPVTQPGDCKGTQATVALRACLQPDRRVDVEVSGLR